MPLWVADFLGDTLDLNAREVGAYMLLLMAMWNRNGRLPDDQTKLQRIARCGREWPRVWDAIGPYFTVESGHITQKRLLREFETVAAKREVNAQSGARGGQAKALKQKEASLANAMQPLKQSEPEPEPEPEPRAEAKSASAPASYRKTDDVTHAKSRKVENQPVSTTLRRRMLEALGLDPDTGLTATGKCIGTPADMAMVASWLTLPGITEDIIVSEMQRIMARSDRGRRPQSIAYFAGRIADLSADFTAPPTTPTPGAYNIRPTPPPTRVHINPDDYDENGKRTRPWSK